MTTNASTNASTNTSMSMAIVTRDGRGWLQDAHELAHAVEIQKRFVGGTATHSQIALFGLTGGLLPCPAAFTIVLVCLQLKRFALGIAMVLSFSAGLAFTLVAAGVLAAWSLRHAEKRFSGLGLVARKLPYLSSGILTVMGLFIGIQGWRCGNLLVTGGAKSIIEF